jgi:hypothetical protein
MALTLAQGATVFDAISASKTSELNEVQGLGFAYYANGVIVEVIGDGSANWTLDIQGKTAPGATYSNIDYIEINKAGVAALANSQLTVNDTTRRRYLIPNPPPYVQLVSVRTAGTLTVFASITSAALSRFLLTTATGGAVVEGAAVEDAAVLGNPLLSGGRYDTTPRTLDNGDAGALAIHSDGSLFTRAAAVAASEVISIRGTPTTTTAILVDPTSGKKIRIVSLGLSNASTTVAQLEVYFGIGATIATNAGKEIANIDIDRGIEGYHFISWPEGGGPVGAADDNLSIREDVSTASNMMLIVLYREE